MQGALKEQVSASVARETHLGKDDNIDRLVGSVIHQVDGSRGVEACIGHPKLRDGGGESDETVTGHSVMIVLQIQPDDVIASRDAQALQGGAWA